MTLALCSRCEVDIDECESDPCRNGGVCVNRHNHYLCECVSDFSGENCEDTVSSCSFSSFHRCPFVSSTLEN